MEREACSAVASASAGALAASTAGPDEQREEARNRQTPPSDPDFTVAVDPEKGPVGGGVAPVSSDPGEVAAGTQPHHEDGDHERGGVDGVAEHGAELADPDDLV